MKIKYVTGSQVKINFAKKQFENTNIEIEIENVNLNIDEIQSEDKFEITIDKAKKAYKILKSPLFVTDTFWEIPALNGFPGAYMKYINKWLTAEDFLNLMKDKKDRNIVSTDTIVYVDENGIKIFIDKMVGKFANEIYKDKDTNDSIDNTVLFGDKYLREHQKENYINFPKQNNAWVEFILFFKRNTKINFYDKILNIGAVHEWFK